MTTFCGTMDYAAPEVLGGKDAAGLRYGMQVDMWSLGIILYMILCGNHPFSDQDQTLESCKKVTFSEPVWKSISDNARDLVLKLIEKNPTLRLNVQDALKHPWFDGLAVEDHVFDVPSSPPKHGSVPTEFESPPVTKATAEPVVAAATALVDDFDGNPYASLLFAAPSTPSSKKPVLKVKETPVKSEIRKRGDDDDDSADEDHSESGDRSQGLSTPPGRAPRVLVPKSSSPSRHPLIPDESWKSKPTTVKPVEERLAVTDDEEDISDDEASQTHSTQTHFGFSPFEFVPRSSELFPQLPPRSLSFRGKKTRTKRR